jgi:hypothetical protein
MVAKAEEGKAKTVPGLILNDKTEVKRFLKALKRMETKKHRQEEFDHSNFSLENYLDKLKGYRVKINLPDN